MCALPRLRPWGRGHSDNVVATLVAHTVHLVLLVDYMYHYVVTLVLARVGSYSEPPAWARLPRGLGGSPRGLPQSPHYISSYVLWRTFLLC